MITGDHPATAQAIAREMGLLQPGDDPAVWVHARATAEDKLKIVRDWKRQGAVVAMTGDGVNDAPALREAHVGIAMGKTGTEVTREASDLLLSDDNFASIVAAVQEGRGIFENIQKALVYLLAGNCGELIVMLGAALVGMPLPLLPLQLLWVNLVTDGLPALALVMDPASPALLLRPPRPPAQPILDRGRWLRIVGVGVVQAAVTLGVFTWALHARDLGEARDLAFTTLVFGEVLRAFPARSTTQVFWEVGALTNLFLVGIGAASVLLQVGIHQLGFTQRLFALTSLSWQDGALCLALGLVPATLQELLKLAIRALRALRAIQAAKGV
jgi:Ca2+-transporting ATPase